MKHRSAIGIGVVVALAAVIVPVAEAQQAANPPLSLHVGPGETLRVRAGDAQAVATVGAPAEAVAIRVLRSRAGRLVEADGGSIPYDIPFVIELEFAAAPHFAATEVAIEWEDGSTRSVTVRRLATDARLFRSARLHLRRPAPCEGIKGALECQ